MHGNSVALCGEVQRNAPANPSRSSGDQTNRAFHGFYNRPMPSTQECSVSAPNSELVQLIRETIAKQGGWLSFERYMALALYAPGLGYYARPGRKFGVLARDGSDFVTAPELSPLFGRTLARPIAQALAASDCAEIWEFGAGSGALAEQLLEALGEQVQRYCIVEVSGALRHRQELRLARHANKVRWLETLPEQGVAVVVANEVLDAMPVQLLHFDGTAWFERGVTRLEQDFAWGDRPGAIGPAAGQEFLPGTTTEHHAQALAFVATLAERLVRGAAFFIDYGFPQAEYYHPQRAGGTLMCHRAHRCDDNPLLDVGHKDITSHLNFTGIALAGQTHGLSVLGYTSQARFLMNCGILELLAGADWRERANAQKLITEHEMGELFKVLGFSKGCEFECVGFAAGDRTHTL
jgi:SAM-dependent MidA family methyltransferase